MNIFVLDYDIKKCALYHNNSHCSKMILEHTQMLCTTLNLLSVETPYRSVHRNHPCRLWVGKSRSNFLWLCSLTKFLGEEFEYRYKKIHKSIEVMNLCFKYANKLDDIGLTEFAQAMPEEFKNSCTVAAYRNYYRGSKKHLANWGFRDVPEWFQINDE